MTITIFGIPNHSLQILIKYFFIKAWYHAIIDIFWHMRYQKQMSKTYFVDSENVGDAWINLLLADPDSTFLIFYTSHSPRIDYEHAIALMNAKNKPQFIRCHEGSNALDFQLVSYLGYQLRSKNTDEMVIVSNDTGFDAVVHFWSEQNRAITRLITRNIPTPEIKTEQATVSEEKADTASSVDTDTEQTVRGVDLKELYTIINCVGSKESSYIHLAYVHFYGIKKGEDLYKYMRQEKFAAPSVSWKKETRFKKFCELIFKYCNTTNTEVPSDFIAYLYTNLTRTDDKKSLNRKLQTQYPHQGMQLHKILKPFYKTLLKIKK